MNAIWIVAKREGYAHGRYELPMWAVLFDEDKAREQARKSEAVLIELAVTEDYRENREELTTPTHSGIAS
jgi:hypothetical protein